MDYGSQRILTLRKGFISAYKKSTGQIIPKDLYDYKNHECYDEIRTDIVAVFKLSGRSVIAVSNSVLRKFLFNSQNFKYFPYNIKQIKEYVEIVNSKKGVRPNKLSSSEKGFINGVLVIDALFLKRMMSNNQHFLPIDFYLANDSFHCQWFGVAKKHNWDITRQCYSEVIQAVKGSFKNYLDSKIAAIISGESGNGKSVFLRSLSVSFSKQYVVMWVVNLRDFANSLTVIKVDLHKQYLLIIEDWDKPAIDKELKSNFLQEISDSENLRIIVGIKTQVSMNELPPVDKKRVFRLSSSENKHIVEKILEKVPEWMDVYLSENFQKSRINECPLYLTLLILELNRRRGGGELGQFIAVSNEIIENEQRRLFAMKKGLALALYYFSNLYLKYNFDATFEAFVEIVNVYNEDKLVVHFEEIDVHNDLREIMSFYVNIEPFVEPLPQTRHTISFKHDLIVQLLANPVYDDWSFDLDKKLGILEILFKANLTEEAYDLYKVIQFELAKSQSKNIFERVKKLSIDIKHNDIDDNVIFLNQMLKINYEEIDKDSDDYQINDALAWLMHCFSDRLMELYLPSILNNFKKSGCNADSLNDAIEKVKNKERLEELIAYYRRYGVIYAY